MTILSHVVTTTQPPTKHTEQPAPLPRREALPLDLGLHLLRALLHPALPHRLLPRLRPRGVQAPVRIIFVYYMCACVCVYVCIYICICQTQQHGHHPLGHRVPKPWPDRPRTHTTQPQHTAAASCSATSTSPSAPPWRPPWCSTSRRTPCGTCFLCGCHIKPISSCWLSAWVVTENKMSCHVYICYNSTRPQPQSLPRLQRRDVHLDAAHSRGRLPGLLHPAVPRALPGQGP